ncbi:MAG: response regulator transcription factor [Actinomycetaceae bacterium]|nr:response regulator transcription factor [Actinomycetaceae bacterium]
MSERIYVADDDPDILNLVTMFLESEDYVVEGFSTGDALYARFVEEPCDLVILDIMMPGTDGLTICNRIRKDSDVPIILLTAKDSDSDYIAGITLGSDDYLTKPFRPTILTVRVKALLRRAQMSRERAGDEEVVVCGNLRLIYAHHSIECEGVEIPFTSNEFECLAVLMAHFKQAVSREFLLTEVWGYNNFPETRVTDETIRRIRKKLGTVDSGVTIENKWGFGYRLIEAAKS